MDNYVALNKAIQFLRQLAEERKVVDKRLVVIGNNKDDNQSGQVLDVSLYTEGYNPKEEVLILTVDFSRIFQPEYAETANKIADKLQSLDIKGKIEVSVKDGKYIISVSYEDITFENLLSIINAYLDCWRLENDDIAVEVTEDQGDGEETKIEDGDYTIFFPDGSHDAYPRKYDL